jgi:hypothetical protein
VQRGELQGEEEVGLAAEHLPFDKARLATDDFCGHCTHDKLFKRGLLLGFHMGHGTPHEELPARKHHEEFQEHILRMSHKQQTESHRHEPQQHTPAGIITKHLA